MILLNRIPRAKPNWVKGSFREMIKYLWMSRNAPTAFLFEKKFSALLGSKHAMAVGSGRAGLLLILKALKLTKGDEIIISAYNSPIVTLTVKKAGLKPVFADIDITTLNMDVSSIKKKLTRKTKGIIVLHTEGQPCDMGSIMLFAKKHKLFVIEDCAHALLAEFNKRKAGTWGDASFFSFGIGKHVNTLGGGMVLTDNDSIFRNMKQEFALVKTGRTSSGRSFARASQSPASKLQLLKKYFKGLAAHVATQPFFFNCITFPLIRFFRMMKKDVVYSLFEDKIKPDDKIIKDKRIEGNQIARDFSSFQAWLGLRQLKMIEHDVLKRRKNAEFLREKLLRTKNIQDIQNIQVQSMVQGGKGSFLQFPIIVKSPERTAQALAKKGVDCQRTWLKCCDASCENAKKAEQRCIYIPVYQDLSSAALERITKALEI